MEAPSFFLLISTIITLVTAVAITLYVRYSVMRALHSRMEAERLRFENREIGKRLLIAQQLTIIGALAGGLTYHLDSTMRGLKELMKILRSTAGNNPTVVKLSEMISQQLTDAISVSNRVCQATYPDRMQLSRASAAEIVTEVVESLNKPVAIEIEIVVACQDELIYGNEQLVRQVVENVLKNAINTLVDGGGKVCIAFSNPVPDKKIIGVSPELTNLQIKITDNGAGMDPEILENVFMPQFGTGDGSHSGVRLGLPLCFAIMQMLQGDITISSQIGKGTSVALNFPLALDQADTKSLEIDRPLLVSLEDMVPYLSDSFVGKA